MIDLKYQAAVIAVLLMALMACAPDHLSDEAKDAYACVAGRTEMSTPTATTTIAGVYACWDKVLPVLDELQAAFTATSTPPVATATPVPTATPTPDAPALTRLTALDRLLAIGDDISRNIALLAEGRGIVNDPDIGSRTPAAEIKRDLDDLLDELEDEDVEFRTDDIIGWVGVFSHTAIVSNANHAARKDFQIAKSRAKIAFNAEKRRQR